MSALGAWRPTLRLARRDAGAHLLRTVLAVALIALPVAALVAWSMVEQAPPPSRVTALAGIPPRAQATITATTIESETPFRQLPEGAPGPWMGSLDALPAAGDALAAIVPGDRLLPYWSSLDLVATTGLGMTPGEEAPAGTLVREGRIDAATLATARLTEADDEALGILLPPLQAGTAPADAADAVVSTALADRLGLRVGDTLALVAPPWGGWYSSNGEGRLGEVFQNVQRGFRVAGTAASDEERVWARAGWMSRAISADPAGVDGRWLVIGPEPVTWDQARALNALQAFAVSRHVLEDYPADADLYPVALEAGTVVLRTVLTVLLTVLGMLLGLGLVTPAFAVAGDQARRMLGLAAVAGATPRDLRRTLLAQGGLVGLAGGLAGTAVGLAGGAALAAAAYPTGDVWARFPWWAPLTGVAVAVATGLVCTLGPARTAARLHPVDAVRDRSTPRPERRPARWRRVARAALPVALLAIAITAGAGAFRAAAAFQERFAQLPVEARSPGQGDPTAGFLVAVAVAAGAGALALGIRPLIAALARLAGRSPLPLRFALRDASDHPSRVVPAAAGVLVSVLAASALIVFIGSATQNSRDGTGQFIAAGRMVIGMNVSISPEFDRLVLADTGRALAEDLPVTGILPIATTAVAGNVQLTAMIAPDKACPQGSVPDTASALDPDRPVTCTDPDHGFAPGLSVAWMGGSNSYVLTPDAVRASGLPGADAAADVLAAGGVIVHDSTRVSRDGQTRVLIGDSMVVGEDEATASITLPGAFLRGFAAPLAVSPETAAGLGVTALDEVGAYVVTERPLTAGELDRARELVTAHTSLVRVATPQDVEPWGRDEALLPLFVLAGLAVAATAVSLLLARTQARRDAVTMYAVGATPSFLRRVALAQGSLILVLGVPAGVAAGLTCGTYLVAWIRLARVVGGGAWNETVPLWGLQGALAATVIGAALVAILLVTRPPRRTVPRTD